MENIIKRNNVNTFGQGKQPIIFCHGLGCAQSVWQYITPSFEEDYEVILFDYVGSGHSDLSAYDPVKYNQLEGYAQDLIEVIESLNLHDVIVVGHSVSSMIGMLASLKRPQLIKKLVMIGPSPCYLNTDEGYQGGFDESDVEELLNLMEMNFKGWASYMAPLGMQKPKESQEVQELESLFVSNDPQIARQFAKVTFLSDYRSYLEKLEIETLILQCAEDSIVPLEIGTFLKQRIKNSQLVVLDVKGHYPQLSHADETIGAIKTFLA